MLRCGVVKLGCAHQIDPYHAQWCAWVGCTDDTALCVAKRENVGWAERTQGGERVCVKTTHTHTHTHTLQHTTTYSNTLIHYHTNTTCVHTHTNRLQIDVIASSEKSGMFRILGGALASSVRTQKVSVSHQHARLRTV
jgi:hypothetical protein